MIRFYNPDIDTDSTLSQVESGHCCRVLRMHEGDEIEVVDGKGRLYRCEITDANPRSTGIEILSSVEIPKHWKPYITLAVAPTKNIDRMEWLAEKAVEIGVDKIIFLNCRHSVRKTVKRDRIEKILISAMKQSLKAKLPEFVEMMHYRDFMNSRIIGKRFIGYCDDNIEKVDFANSYDGLSDITILIGPEGDFSPEEIKMALNHEFQPVTFGNTRLRTETAALYALCATHTIITQISTK